MKHSFVETALGAFVIAVAVVFLAFSYSVADVSDVEGYTLRADFTSTGGLKPGDDVEISGVKVGTVMRVALNSENYQAQVFFSVKPDVKVPDDTAALISSVSLLGGRYLSLEPGGSEEFLSDGGIVSMTQSPQNLEQLLGKFIFSQSGQKEEEKQEAQANPLPVNPQETEVVQPQSSPSEGEITTKVQPATP